MTQNIRRFAALASLTAGVGMTLTLAAQTPAPAQHDHSAPASGAAAPAPDPKMSQMMPMMCCSPEQDARLDALVATMNAATGTAKVDAMAALLNALVAERATMHQQMMGMMKMMDGMPSGRG